MANEETPAAGHRAFRANSIFLKLAVAITAASVLVCGLLAFEYTRAMREVLSEVIRNTAMDVTAATAEELGAPIRFGDMDKVGRTLSLLTGHENSETVYGFAMGVDGGIVAKSGPASGFEPALTDLARKAIDTGAAATSEDGFLIALPTRTGDAGALTGALALAWTDTHTRDTALSAQVSAVIVAFGTFALVLVVLLWLIARMVVSPIRSLTAAVNAVAGGNYKVGVAGTGRGDEIGDIAKALERFRHTLAKGAEQVRENTFRGVAFEGSAAAIMMADADMTITAVNPALEQTLTAYAEDFRDLYADYDPARVVGSQMDFYHPPEIRDRIRSLLRDPANLPYRATIAIGRLRFSLDINMVHDEDGACMGYVVEWNDVTREYMNNAILASIDANQVKAEFDLDGRFINSNRLFREMMDIPADALCGRNMASVFAFDNDISKQRGTVFDRLAGGESVFGRFDLPRDSGQIAVVDGGFTPVVDDKGTILHYVLIGNDVTETARQIESSEMRRAEMEKAQNQVVEGLRIGLERLSDGDLTVKIESAFDPDHDQLRIDFNRAVDRLQAAMQGVVENADLIRGEAREISNAADDLSSRTERQAATLEETASALDQLTSSVSSAADGAAHANDIVESARRNAESSGEVVREAVGAMSEIESSSQQISKITGVIDDIAFQTNLLALNAGVEAARAGEAGRGFAVVASEVRALAQRSSEAAREINQLISASGTQVKRGVDLVGHAGEALQGIVGSVGEISQKVSEIAVSAREQSAGLAEINEAVNQLDQVTQQNAAMFEETTAASHALTSEAEALTETMARFQIGTPQPGAGDDVTVVDASAFSSRRAAAAAAPPAAAVARAAAGGPAPAAAPAVPDIDDDWDDF